MHINPQGVISFIFTMAMFNSVALLAEVQHGHEHHHKHEYRHHESHVHGVALLNVALEGEEVHIELDTPAANIVGFEHAPSSKAEHKKLDNAFAMLKKGNMLFSFNSSAGCRLEKAYLESALLEYDDHGHEEQSHPVGKEKMHSDIEAVYHFECDNPTKVTQLSVELFEAFSGMAKLNVQYVSENKQGAVMLTPALHVIKF